MLLTQSLEASTLFKRSCQNWRFIRHDGERSNFFSSRYILVYPQYVDIAYRQLENHFEQGALSANINSAKTLQSLSVSETINLEIAFHGLIGKQLHEQTIL